MAVVVPQAGPGPKLELIESAGLGLQRQTALTLLLQLLLPLLLGVALTLKLLAALHLQLAVVAPTLQALLPETPALMAEWTLALQH